MIKPISLYIIYILLVTYWVMENMKKIGFQKITLIILFLTFNIFEMKTLMNKVMLLS